MSTLRAMIVCWIAATAACVLLTGPVQAQGRPCPGGATAAMAGMAGAPCAERHGPGRHAACTCCAQPMLPAAPAVAARADPSMTTAGFAVASTRSPPSAPEETATPPPRGDARPGPLLPPRHTA